MERPFELLFSYGTLQKREVQLAQFGRELRGREDGLAGFTERRIEGLDPKVAALITQPYCVTLDRTFRGEDVVRGVVFEITLEELAAADRYEKAADYERIRVRLQSGDEAWVYVMTD